MQEVAPAAAQLPSWQTSQDDAPSQLLLPAAQRVQAAAPLPLLYVPAAQGAQVEAPAVLNAPAVQATHAAKEVPPVPVLAFPAGQSMHDDWPVRPWYVPAAHDRQAVDELPAFELYLPATQGVHDVEPGDAANEPGMQNAHVSTPATPTAVLYVPAAHKIQEAVPLA